MKKPVHRAVLLGDAINMLSDLETTFAELQTWDEFQSFNTRQRAEYHESLSKLRELIEDLSGDLGEEQMAS